ncbi:BRE [Cordylochernes scorpioides]|uniref:BRISC and BRCA1-A complex member 2 n=1 Tax=Cordylochernes scorpioides TaxID=51811 RepID=A0ABY6LQ45_9ARAC|nr:BRE [Cordylochernes scorpioides]
MHEFPPDFIFDQNFRPNIAELESLRNWQCEDPSSLHKVLKQLLEQYRRREVNLLETYSRLQFEYSSLLHLTPEQDVEVALNHKVEPERPSLLPDPTPSGLLLNTALPHCRKFAVWFAIHGIICVVPNWQDNPGKDSALLLVLFHNPEANGITPRLMLSPRVENAFAGHSSHRIPHFAPGECLIDYVPKICDLLKDRLKHVVESFEKRKEFVSAFLSHFGRSVVEYDAESFFFIVLLFEWRDFYFILHITLTHQFPAVKPIFTFQSIYHTNKQGEPYTHTYSEYPFSPRWSGNEMAERTWYSTFFIFTHTPSGFS